MLERLKIKYTPIGNQRILALVIIMILVVVLVGGSTLGLLYQTAFDQFQAQLADMAKSRANLINAVASYDIRHSDPGDDPTKQTLSQLHASQEKFAGFGQTGEYTLAKRANGKILFVLRQRHGDLAVPEPIPMWSKLSQQMRLALLGESGVAIGLDYRGRLVLAAYEPVDALNMGIVAKIDMSEIRAPFIKTSAKVAIIALVVIWIGVIVFYRISTPILERLANEEQRLLKILGTSPTPIIISRISDSMVRYANPAAEALFGVSTGKFFDHRITDLYAGQDDQNHIIDALEEVGEISNYELPIRRPDGTEVLVNLNGRLSELENEKVMIAGLLDITERKRIEEQLHFILDSTPVPLIITRLTDGMFLYANPATSAMFGIADDDLVGHLTAELYANPESRNAMIAELVKTGEVRDYELRLKRKGGGEFWAKTNARKSEFNGEVVLIAGLIDITESKQAEIELRKLSQAVKQSPASVIITAPNGAIEYVNPKFESVSGYTLAEIVGKNPRILNSGETTKEEYKKLWDSVLSGHEWRGEFHNKRKDGSLFWESVLVSPIIGADGEITNLLAVKEDITALKTAEDALRQSQKMKAVGQLTGGIAHDFNNMLGVIMGNLDLLRRTVADNPIALSRVDAAYAGSLRGAAITKKLLSFSQGDGEIKRVTSVNGFIEGMESLIAKSLTAKVSFETNLGENIWPVMIAPGSLEDTLLNLSLNALDAMPNGGTLMIETTNKFLDERYVHSNPESKTGGYVLISVSDTGVGMSPDEISQIFQPFYTTKEVGKGTGLGLSMVYGFVQQSGGHIKVYSEPGEGSTFRIFLPRAIDVGDDLGAVGPALKSGLPRGS